MPPPDPPIAHHIEKQIRTAVQLRVNEIADEEIKAAQERIQKRIGNEVAQIAVNVSSMINTTIGDEIVIAVRKQRPWQRVS